jgi:uncharacterized protein (DUF1501 family)
MKRRDFIQQSIALAGASCLPTFLPRVSQAQIATTGQVIFVFLRGGADALSLTPPTGTTLTRLNSFRPNEFVSGAIPLYSGSPINVHPLLAPLLNDAELKSRLNFVLHSGSTYNTLSHFEQMARVETGNMTSTSRDGILGRAATTLNRATFAIGNSIPTSLRGTNPIVLSDPAKLSNGFSATNLKPGPDYTRSQRLGMYKKVGTEVGDANIDAAAQLAQTQFDLIQAGSATTIGNLVPSANGYVNDVYSLGNRLALAAHMLSSAANPAFVAVDAEMQWDTHANQYTNDINQFKSFATKADALGKNLLALKRDLVARGKWATTAVVVISEFGRTVRENGSRGTDHGRGGLMILMGGRIRPFSDPLYTGTRSWNVPTTVDASTALSVNHDYRTVLAEVLQKNCAMTQTQLANVFLNQISFSNYLGVI